MTFEHQYFWYSVHRINIFNFCFQYACVLWKHAVHIRRRPFIVRNWKNRTSSVSSVWIVWIVWGEYTKAPHTLAYSRRRIWWRHNGPASKCLSPVKCDSTAVWHQLFIIYNPCTLKNVMHFEYIYFQCLFSFYLIKAAPFQYEIVAIVANDADINSVHDLRGSRFCHPGHGLKNHWTDVLANVSELFITE